MLGILAMCAGVPFNVYAAEVSCTFISEIQITKNGEWMKSEMDFMKLVEMFGDGLVLP
jgi:hypothetical protein